MNSLSKKTDINLNTVRSKEVALRSAATSSLMSQFMLIDLLFYTYVLEDYDKHMENILNSRELVDDYKRMTSKR
jgi:DNA-binding MurR/RpiR family transcriptional regulator